MTKEVPRDLLSQLLVSVLAARQLRRSQLTSAAAGVSVSPHGGAVDQLIASTVAQNTRIACADNITEQQQFLSQAN